MFCVKVTFKLKQGLSFSPGQARAGKYLTQQSSDPSPMRPPESEHTGNPQTSWGGLGTSTSHGFGVQGNFKYFKVQEAPADTKSLWDKEMTVLLNNMHPAKDILCEQISRAADQWVFLFTIFPLYQILCSQNIWVNLDRETCRKNVGGVLIGIPEGRIREDGKE